MMHPIFEHVHIQPSVRALILRLTKFKFCSNYRQTEVKCRITT